jgi:hypothetical protein
MEPAFYSNMTAPSRLEGYISVHFARRRVLREGRRVTRWFVLGVPKYARLATDPATMYEWYEISALPRALLLAVVLIDASRVLHVRSWPRSFDKVVSYIIACYLYDYGPSY